MTKHIPADQAAKQLTAYGVALFESLKELKKIYPEQVLDMYRAIIKSIVADEPSALEVLR